MTYASNTNVTVERTRAELDALLRRHGAAQRVTAEDDVDGYAIVGFTIAGRQVRLNVPLPKLADFKTYLKKFRGGHSGEVDRSPAQQRKAYDQACAARWRGVLLICKAKLEYIEYGNSTVEHEFMADISLPNGQSVAEWLRPQIAEAYAGGGMPLMLGPASVATEEPRRRRRGS